MSGNESFESAEGNSRSKRALMEQLVHDLRETAEKRFQPVDLTRLRSYWISPDGTPYIPDSGQAPKECPQSLRDKGYMPFDEAVKMLAERGMRIADEYDGVLNQGGNEE